MQGPQYLFDVVNEAGQSASFLNGGLIWNSIYTQLDLSPTAWQTLSILTERNKEYFGIDVSYGTPQDFVLSAGQILKSIAYLSGIETTCYLRILEQQLWFTDTEYGYYYTKIAKTEIDLSTFVDSGAVNANVLDGDIVKYLKANGNTDYSIDLDVPERVPVVMDGAVLLQSASFIIQDPFDLAFTGAGNHIMGLALVTQEQKSTIGTKTTARIKQDVNAAIFATGDDILATSGESKVTVTVDTAVTVQAFPGSSLPVLPTLRYFMSLRVFDAQGNEVVYPGNDNLLFDSGPGFESGIGRHVIKVTKTLIVPANCTVYPISGCNATNASYSNGLQFVYDNNSVASPSTPNFSLQYTYRFKSTLCYGLTPKVLFNKLIDKMSGGRYTQGASSIMDNPDIPLVFSCGDALRQLVGAQIKISMKRFFAALNVPWGIGMGSIGGVLTIERKSFWVSPGDPGVQLGTAGSYKLYPAVDMLASSIKIGYPNQTYNTALGDINGKYEVCVTQVYDTPTARVSKVLDITTDVRGDMIGSEFTRINLDGKTSISDNADNDVFMYHVEKTTSQVLNPVRDLRNPSIAAYRLDRSINPFVLDNNIFVTAGDPYVVAGISYTATVSQYTQVGLLDKDSAFNVALSPKQCLLRAHGDYLHSILEKCETKYLTFDTSNKNSSLTIMDTRPGGIASEENGNVLISSLKPPIFRPWIFEPIIVNPPELSTTIVGNPVRKYLCDYQNIPMSGTAIKSAISPTDNATQAYQLLLDPSVDITPFINVYE